MSRLARLVTVLLITALPVLSLFTGGIGRTSGAGSSSNSGPVAQQTSTHLFYLPLVMELPYWFALQNGGPAYLANFANTFGCNWMGIAGQAFDSVGKPIIGLIVHLEGGGLNLDALTGSKPEYGPSGYEFFLADHPIETANTYRVQLRATTGAPLSDFFAIPTFADCSKNLALVNFAQLKAIFLYTLQDGAPSYLSNFANTAGCNWQGIAGQVFDLNGRPVIGLLVHLEGGGLNVDTLTGSKPEYGQSGYEFFLTDQPQTTTDTYRIQLRNTAGQPLSDVYVIPTFANTASNTCPRNLALVNFVQNY